MDNIKNKHFDEKISVIIPTWNSAKTLNTTINSCLEQTLKPIEILVCDDGSTDNSKEIIEKINNPIVVWIPGEHSGNPAVPRNNGMKIAKGEWFAFCDSDDEWLPAKLEKQIGEMIEKKTNASCTNALIKNNNIITKKKVVNFKKTKIKFCDLIKNNYVICSSTIINSCLYKGTGGFPEEKDYSSFEDYIYWLRLSTKTIFSFIDEPLVIYDNHPETSVRSNKISGFKLKKIVYENILEWNKKNTKNLIFKQTYTSIVIKQKYFEHIKNIIRKIIKQK